MIRDTEIIRRIRQGDIGQFESLFRSSYASLVRYAKRIIKDHDTAEEIVQDFFVRFWQEKENITIKSSLNGYLFRSIHNRCLHWIDHNNVVEKHRQELLLKESGYTETPADIIQAEELQQKITIVLERLPERCSRIFCMNRFDGLKYSEIAEKLSVSVKTVEANMGKALKEFHKALKEK